jgi:hypothetical protein
MFNGRPSTRGDTMSERLPGISDDERDEEMTSFVKQELGMPEPQPVPVVAQAAIVREARGGRRKATVLIVAEPDPAKAREILRGRLPGFHVDELYPLPSGCLEAFGLKAGEYTRWLAEGLE